MKHKTFKRRAYSEFDIRLKALKLASAHPDKISEYYFSDLIDGAKRIEGGLKKADKTPIYNPSQDSDHALEIAKMAIDLYAKGINLDEGIFIGNVRTIIEAIRAGEELLSNKTIPTEKKEY